ncbi:MAG: undecaprenyl-diphosphate phosphatase [Ilumatobacteraceae bacterium]
MPITHAIVLGLVQGLSEFLPISSSGHLLLVPWLFGWKDFESESVEKAFDVALHIGTVFAAIAYFRNDLVRYVHEGLALVVRRERPATQDGKLAWLLVVSTIPAAAVGALFESQIDERLGTPTIIAVSLIVFGLVLALADRAVGHRRVESYTARGTLLVGAAQAIALNPGTSRSGITMTAARLRGFDRESAARLSFLMMIPVTTGAVLLKMVGLIAEGIPDGLHLPMVVGVVTSGLAGWFAVWGTIRFVKTRSFTPFVIYRVALGIAVLVIVAAGWR